MLKSLVKIQALLILLILLLLPIYLIKIRLGWISFNALEVLIGAAFVVWLLEKRKEFSLPHGFYNLPVFLIIAGLLLSFVANGNYYAGLGVVKGWFVLPLVFAVIFYGNLQQDFRLLNKAWLALFYSGFGVALIGVAYIILGIFTYDGRLHIFWDSPNQMAMFLVPPFLIGLLMAIQGGKSGKKYFYVFGVFLIGLNIYFSFSYGAWLAIALSLVAVFFSLDRSRFWKSTFIIAAVVLLLAASQIGNGKLGNYLQAGVGSSLDSRLAIWQSSFLMIKNNPLEGVGPANFQKTYLEYQKYFPPYLEWAVPQPHSIYLAFWLEAGALGIAGFLLLLLNFFRDIKKTIIHDRLNAPICLSVMLYYLIHGLVDTTYWRNDMAIVFWMVVAVNAYLASVHLGKSIKK